MVNVAIRVLLKFFQLEAYLPQQASAVPYGGGIYRKAVKVAPEQFEQYQWHGRTYPVHRFASCTASGKRQLMIQQVLHKPQWQSRMRSENHRALTPLIYSQVTPYGRFRLDMTSDW